MIGRKTHTNPVQLLGFVIDSQLACKKHTEASVCYTLTRTIDWLRKLKLEEPVIIIIYQFLMDCLIAILTMG